MIQITDKEITSTEGKYVHRLGTDVYFKRATKLPTDTPEMFEEADSIPEPTGLDYKEKVVEKVRRKYTVDDELAILRQRDTKPEEYQAYYDYVEAVKAEVKANNQNKEV